LGLCGSRKKCIQGVAVREIAVFWGQVKATSGGEDGGCMRRGGTPHKEDLDIRTVQENLE